MKSIYERLISAGCVVEGRESDLHTPATPEALRLIREFRHDGTGDLRLAHNVYVSRIDGSRWVEVPFAYDPFWIEADRKAKDRA